MRKLRHGMSSSLAQSQTGSSVAEWGPNTDNFSSRSSCLCYLSLSYTVSNPQGRPPTALAPTFQPRGHLCLMSCQLTPVWQPRVRLQTRYLTPYRHGKGRESCLQETQHRVSGRMGRWLYSLEQKYSQVCQKRVIYVIGLLWHNPQAHIRRDFCRTHGLQTKSDLTCNSALTKLISPIAAG